MASRGTKKDRNVIPRWRSSALAVHLGEAQSSGSEVSVGALPLGHVLDDWHSHPTLGTAADLISTAVAGGTPSHAVEAAEFILRQEEVPGALGRLARQVAGRDHRQEIEESSEQDETVSVRSRSSNLIRTARQRLRRDPRNALAWNDLALGQASVGGLSIARRAMLAALAIAPTNRLLLRSGARLFVHLDEPETGLAVLRRNRGTLSDPWLVAAELSVAQAAQKPPQLVKAGRALLTAGNWSARSYSELSAALGTLEAHAGNARDARRLFRGAMVDPTENSVAQADWVTENITSVVTNRPNVDRAFEADAEAAITREDWEAGLRYARRWLADEPFSSRPALAASFAATIGLEAYAEAEQIARIGLDANPHHAILLNNLAFALARSGRAREAEKFVQRGLAAASEAERPTLWATEGAIAYRTKQTPLGRELYERAVVAFAAANHRSAALLALLFWIEEEARHDLGGAREMFADIDGEVSAQSDPALRTLHSRLIERLGVR